MMTMTTKSIHTLYYKGDILMLADIQDKTYDTMEDFARDPFYENFQITIKLALNLIFIGIFAIVSIAMCLTKNETTIAMLVPLVLLSGVIMMCMLAFGSSSISTCIKENIERTVSANMFDTAMMEIDNKIAFCQKHDLSLADMAFDIASFYCMVDYYYEDNVRIQLQLRKLLEVFIDSYDEIKTYVLIDKAMTSDIVNIAPDIYNNSTYPFIRKIHHDIFLEKLADIAPNEPLKYDAYTNSLKKTLREFAENNKDGIEQMHYNLKRLYPIQKQRHEINLEYNFKKFQDSMGIPEIV